MKHGDFELLSVAEMREKYDLTAENRPEIRLDPERVPLALRGLIPHAEVWGIKDDLVRDDFVRRAPEEAIEELKRIIELYEDPLDEWLAGPEVDGPHHTEEYLAFSAMRMAADFS